MEYYGHSSEDGRFQLLSEHLNNTAKLAAEFAEPFGASEAAYLLGLAHDIGKYSDKFQKKIRVRGTELKVDHSTAAAQELVKINKLLAYCAAGHHGGLPDGGGKFDGTDKPTLEGRLRRAIENYSQFSEEIELKAPTKPIKIKPIGKGGFTCSFFTRMLFSCLVDGDYLDTAAFMDGYNDNRHTVNIIELAERLNKHLRKFDNPVRDIDIKRSEILKDCFAASHDNRGLYTLTVPTGGGKTLSSLAFALNHAKEHDLSHVIYVIPYTSIIEQTVSVFSEALGAENVLAHYAIAEYDDNDDDMSQKTLAVQNWDTPLIVTTAVQFFESLFSNKPSKCRKLHNIANSVIIFDEAQMLPIQYLIPCIRAISELVINYGCSVVLCTATQPALEKFFIEDSVNIKSKEICKNPTELYEFFRRTSIRYRGVMSNADLASELEKFNQVLCIVNTRKLAGEVFDLLPDKGRYHLSTLMTPVHRKRVLEDIRDSLKNGQTCRVVATSLIEAGVDVDFPIVYRAEAGLDSILQAAGRCNREGKRPLTDSTVNVFTPENGETSLFRQDIKLFALTREKYTDDKDLSSLQAIRYYFELLHKTKGTFLDRDKIVDTFEDGICNNLSFPFKTVADNFKLIDTSTKQLFIPIDINNDDNKHKILSAAQIYNALLKHEYSKSVIREAGKYTVEIWPDHYSSLYKSGDLTEIEDGLAVLNNLTLYSKEKGLSLKADEGKGLFI